MVVFLVGLRQSLLALGARRAFKGDGMGCCGSDRRLVTKVGATAPIWAQESVDCGRYEWTPVEPAGTCPGHESVKLGGSEDPWTTGARHDRSTIGGRRGD